MTEPVEKQVEIRRKKEIERASGEPIAEELVFVPEVDLTENKDTIIVYADMPGVDKDSIDIDIREGILTLTGKVNPVPKHHHLVYQEYEIGGYQRRFNLGQQIDPSKINAKLADGVLKLTLPKIEEHKPRKIKIEV